jgi:hypothetical protein
MCWGNNARIIRTLGEELITFEEILLCARNTALHPSLRSRYVKLMMGKSEISLLLISSSLSKLPSYHGSVMYVDVDNNRNVLENLPLSFVSICLL